MPPSAGGLDAHHHVLGDGEHGDEHEVLMHHPDAGGDRVAWRGEVLSDAVDEDLALIGPVQAVQDVHQRALAGAVLADEGEHLAATHAQVDVVVGDDAGESLRDPP